MTRGPYFIDRDAFESIIQGVPRKDGGAYEDVETIYGDLSRLVVAWLARTSPEELKRMYNELGWGGAANIRAIRAAAKAWCAAHRPELLKRS